MPFQALAIKAGVAYTPCGGLVLASGVAVVEIASAMPGAMYVYAPFNVIDSPIPNLIYG
jgi:hypothetical protein